MLCFAYSSPVNCSLIIDREKYNLYISLEDDCYEDFSKFVTKRKKGDERQKLLFIDSYQRLLGYAKQYKMKKVKVVLFDTAQRIVRHGLTPLDAVESDNGVWYMRKLGDDDINMLISLIDRGGIMETVIKQTKEGAFELGSDPNPKQSTELVPLAIETLSPLGVGIEAVINECEDAADADNIRKSFLLYLLGWLEDNKFQRFLNKLIKEGYTKKIIKASSKLIESDYAESLANTVLDIKFFGTPVEISVTDNECAYEDFEYLCQFINLKELDILKCQWGVEDLENSLLVKRLPKAARVETESKLGTMIEDFIEKVEHAPINSDLRRAFIANAIGVGEEKNIKDLLKKRTYPKMLYKNIIKEAETNKYFNSFYNVVLRDVKPHEACAKFKCSNEDWLYILAEYDPSKVDKEALLFDGDEVDSM